MSDAPSGTPSDAPSGAGDSGGKTLWKRLLIIVPILIGVAVVAY